MVVKLIYAYQVLNMGGAIGNMWTNIKYWLDNGGYQVCLFVAGGIVIGGAVHESIKVGGAIGGVVGLSAGFVLYLIEKEEKKVYQAEHPKQPIDYTEIKWDRLECTT